MGGGIVVVVCLLAATGASSLQHDESELSQLPKLFHLDDYEKCMAEQDSIYCLGQFQVYSEEEAHPTYSLIQKYSQDPDLYNRTYLHRGYCVSRRCPGGDGNLSARFERCVDSWAQRRHGLRARLHTLHYCKEDGKPLPKSPDTQDLPHRVFLYVVWTLLALNIIGTTYDLNVEAKEKSLKDGLLRMWSIRQNWKVLTMPPRPHEDTRMDSMHGIKALLLSWGPMYCHASIFLTGVYQRNPRFMEKFLLSPAGPMIGALTNATQGHMVISNFVTAHVLLHSPNVSFKSLPKLILKRLVRMLPVYLLAIGFAATWWTSAGDGPMWHHLMEHESSVCRRKFWISASFLQNLIDPASICLVHTWIMAVDMQLHIPVLVLTLLLKKCQSWAHVILSTLSVASVAVVTHLAFEHNYVPAYTYMTPEVYRVFFTTNDSFVNFFMSPNNCVLAAIFGVWTAFVNKEIQERKIQLNGRMVWTFLTYASLMFAYVWAFFCFYLKKYITDPWQVTAMVPIERIIYCIIMGMTLITLVNVDCKLTALLRWSNLRPISRMSLAIAMAHWLINGILIGNRYTLQDSSLLLLLQDLLTTFTLSCALALPLTLMVDLPMQKTLDKVINSL